MARRSKWEAFKPKVIAAFKAGVTAKQVVQEFKVPSGTVYEWFKEYRGNIGEIPGNTGKGQVESSELMPQLDSRVPESSTPPPPRLRVLAGEDNNSDFAIARRTLRAIAKDNQCPMAVRVQAAMGLLRTVQIRNEIHKNVLDEVETTSLDDECYKLKNLSEEELTRLYIEKVRCY